MGLGVVNVICIATAIRKNLEVKLQCRCHYHLILNILKFQGAAAGNQGCQ